MNSSTIAPSALAGGVGQVVKELGDGLMLWFDQVDARVSRPPAASCEAIETARSERGFPLSLRMGMHCGEVVARGADFVGQTVNIASRIADLAGPGELLVSEAGRRCSRRRASGRGVPTGRPDAGEGCHLADLAVPPRSVSLEGERDSTATDEPAHLEQDATFVVDQTAGMQRRSIVIDTDTASDDAVALVLAVQEPTVDVRAVTVVAGNVPLDLAVRNAIVTLDLCGGADIPVHAGLAEPMARASGHGAVRARCRRHGRRSAARAVSRGHVGRRGRCPAVDRRGRAGPTRPRHARTAHQHRGGTRGRPRLADEVRPHLSDGRFAGWCRQRRCARRVQRVGRPGGCDGGVRGVRARRR